MKLEEALPQLHRQVKDKLLRRAWPTLTQDIAALLGGVRSCVMLDYVQLPAGKLHKQLIPLWEAWHQLHVISVLQMEDAIFLIRRSLLVDRMVRDLQHPEMGPLFVRVDTGTPQICPEAAASPELAQFLKALK
eukprot:CAMPEP_0118941334 /NCGR_PEP_ID=MMETSP1169-20130426/33617_1 /TAXON_ID=36882 /ORGANISM="Pyramimonas obovata, Strain CCMP722" /LENGTH=132 /DNA_ID=CAMNT_0006886055 /DNA_START=284 /DNA_END=679 /DNA_ORIENTATION=-